ncbi:pentapeptide repeat-containing protein, partial [Amycolatopsis sp. H20-H5]
MGWVVVGCGVAVSWDEPFCCGAAKMLSGWEVTVETWFVLVVGTVASGPGLTGVFGWAPMGLWAVGRLSVLVGSVAVVGLVVFCGAVFCGAVFCGAVFCGAVFCGAVFCGAVFCGAVFCGAVFCGAVFCGAVFCGAVF